MNRIIDRAEVLSAHPVYGRAVEGAWHDADSSAQGQFTIAIDVAAHDALRAAAETYQAALAEAGDEEPSTAVQTTFHDAVKLALDTFCAVHP